MKQFFKFTFASCLGVLLAMIVIGFISTFIVGIFVSSSSQSSQKADIKDNTILTLTLGAPTPELTNNTTQRAFDFENPDVPGLHDVIDMIERAAEDDNIKGIFINSNKHAISLSSTRLLRSALNDFKTESGKPVITHANAYNQLSYSLASAADSIFLSPTGAMDFRGFGAVQPFVKGTLSKLGIKMDVFYAGEYKSATEMFRRTNMSEENKEQVRAYINEAYSNYLADIADSRDMTSAQLRALSNDLSTLQAVNAHSSGMVDVLGYKMDALDALKHRIGLEKDDKMYLLDLNSYFTTRSKSKSGDRDNRVAVVYAEGEITNGEDQPGVITADRYVSTLRKLRKDEKVKAIVLRVNSPGGSVIASDDIWAEIERIQAAGKPVITSMGDLAASGGYYIACSTDKIISQPNTITGSIGVFSMMTNTRELMEDKIGMNFDTVSTGKYSTRLNGLFDLDENERTAIQKIVDDYYELFLNRVAEGRSMTRDDVHEVARGRIWTGTQAKERGLVDEIGGLEDAITEAASMAELEDYRIYSYPKVKNQWEQLIADLTGKDDSAKSTIDAKIGEFIPHYEFYRACMKMDEPQARLPFIMKY
jgi:protease-4